MSVIVDSSGNIEIICEESALRPGQMARLIFRAWEDTMPPFQIRVRSPSGTLIVDRVIRELPTSEPQSAPPITFSVWKGDYTIEVNELKGNGAGTATLRVPK